MIINIDAFRKSENIIHQQMDRMNSGRAIDLIAEVRPVVIIDEPQSVDSTPKAKEAIGWLNPLFMLRYSATHRDKTGTLYRLTPLDAYQQGLVKQIAVTSIAAMDDFNRPYLRLVSVDNQSGYKARVELDIKSKGGKLTRTVKTLAVGADLFLISGEREIYRGWRITDIDCMPGNENIELSGTHKLMLGQSMGDVPEMEIKRAQIRKTVEIHLDTELRLLSQGIKVLSLFFIDRVERYRASVDNKGVYAQMFEECYLELINKPKYEALREVFHKNTASLTTDHPLLPTIHGGYFSVDKKGVMYNKS